jgi:hypothetical protein
LADTSPLQGVAGWAERSLYRPAGIDPSHEMTWPRYAVALLSFNAIGILFVYAVQRLQLWLPLNPQHFANISPDSAFNTAVSFGTNTDWQGYAGESSMSYFTQMLVLTVQNFLSAATGIAVAFALIRGFARHSAKAIGNFWVDLTRSTVFLLLPLSLLLSIALMSQGVIQNFSAYRDVTTVEPLTYDNSAQGCPGKAPDRIGDDPDAVARHGSGRLAGGNQDDRHQRRRLLQRELGAPVRKPHAAHEFPADALDVPDSGGAVLCLRTSGGRFTPGMGHFRRHDDDFHRHGGARHVGGIAG